MIKSPQSLVQSQDNAALWLLRGASAVLPMVGIAAYAAGNSLALAPVLAAVFLALGWAARTQGGAAARLGAAVAVIGQSIGLTTAMAGHAWQLDMHMTFFAALATLILLVDIRAVLVATGLIVVHHLSLGLLMPGLIYPSADLLGNIARTLLHGAVVSIESAALIAAIVVRLRLQAQAEERERALAEARVQTDRMLEQTETARVLADAQRIEADQLRALAEAAQARTAAESQRAEAAHRLAREAEAQDAARREAAMQEQQQIVAALREALNRLSGGDLTVGITTGFPAHSETLRQDFNAAIGRLGDAISDVSRVSHGIQGAAGAISNAAQDMALRTERQAATLEETSAAMSDFAASVRASATLASEAEASTAHARIKAIDGGTVVEQAIESMQRIAESSQKIAQINSVIDEIAFQTNLLALNAGVEAARAGEAGRGFAVVASEVRALSQRCSDAAKEITGLVEEAGLHVHNGVSLVGQTGAALTAITGSVAAAAEQVAAIARTAKDQTLSLTEITSAIANLDTVTQQNASMFGETTAACRSLDAATRKMIEMVSQFTTAESTAAPVLRRLA
ncbi:methyl-accepting chemotaxis protein [Pseudotabrizicola algicola]|uniref:Methyl-accepting chemotaxis protein n=1 Tax=Pseudotabrizicola algicola TaxID=2709381 RepID=A0A6B3RVN0_9RHOB|nr:methyl-accepting chemotaxis protein [Pseudotabrizicola algicola]NEX47945.1 methyl-accepting chemotaxis protein [Pseudotabrizicola algicola]